MRRGVVLLIGVLGCGAESAREDTSRAAPDVEAAAATGDPTGADTSALPACPANGLWSLCAVVERLDRAGLAPRVDSARAVDEPPLTAPGALVHVGSAELEVYVYPGSAARARDIARVDTTRYLGYTEAVSMQQLPTLIQSVNLVAILHSRNDHQRERVGDALTAGPPQPSGLQRNP